ncbi:hypothetical protein HYN59_04320 [Flavobacterium album]|uniref:Uncharacterized protein n=1 Tax=Flavobacterium album TaxID=2175091 RepID=A0A2S1QVI3_9FLAO|nr:DUF2683 family protein [Flavobacterium album]AWH84386.1 hypothetical protein HYN59_04320 [Flavobacterium album]
MDVVFKNVKKKDLPFLRSLAEKMGFEIAQNDDKPYNPEFVKEILEASEEVRNGGGKRIEMKDLDKFLGL